MCFSKTHRNRTGQNTLETSENKLNFDSLSLFKQALTPISDELEVLVHKIPEMLSCDTQIAQTMVHYLFNTPGKMIRPALYFLSCQLVGYDGPHKYTMGAVSEFVHTASLLHDDIVDSSSLRRNKPTTNSIWGDASAVLLGDLIYARASELMAQTSQLEIVSSFARAIRLMSESELLQLEGVFNLDLTEEVYFKILHGKTAVLIGTSCKTAALLAGASDKQIQCLEDFGMHIGIAFQLVDDSLDFLGEGRLLGKKTYIDLKEGKVTLPIILMRQCLSERELEDLKHIYAQGCFTQSEIEQISTLVQRYETAEKTLLHAQSLTQKALQSLHEHFPPSLARSNLEELAHLLSLRMH
jgi:octaprenyl-diphosphate synthase